MKLVHIEHLIQAGEIETELFWSTAIGEVQTSIKKVVWPPGNPLGEFAIFPESGKKRGEGNGVKPIKNDFLIALNNDGWDIREHANPHRFDAVKYDQNRNYIGLEWETGNISSSHRSINRILLAHQLGECQVGMLILPTKNLAQFLTDRVGNYEELSHFFPVWRDLWDRGELLVLAVEHDKEDPLSPKIPKATDGRARS